MFKSGTVKLLSTINNSYLYDDIPEPYLAVYDNKGVEYSDMETLEKFGAELISWEMPQPIENSFRF